MNDFVILLNNHDFETATKILSIYPDMVDSAIPINGGTPLLVEYSHRNDYDVVCFLLDQNANPNCQSGMGGYSSVHLAQSCLIVYELITAGINLEIRDRDVGLSVEEIIHERWSHLCCDCDSG